MAKKKPTLFEKIRRAKGAPLKSERGSIKLSMWFKWLSIAMTVGICTFFLTFHLDVSIYEQSDFNAVVGQPWPDQTIVADFSFPIKKSRDEYAAEVEKARQNARQVYLLKRGAYSNAENRLDRIEKKLNEPTPQSDVYLRDFYSERSLKLFSELSTRQKARDARTIVDGLKSHLRRVYRYGFIRIPLESVQKTEIYALAPPNRKIILKKENLTDMATYKDETFSNISTKIETESIPLLEETIKITQIPNLEYDKDLTKKEEELAEQSVARTKGIVRKGETIISKGEPVTKEHILELQSYESFRFVKSESLFSVWSLAGGVGHMAILISLLILYLFIYRKEVFYDNYQLLLLCGSIVAVAALSWVTIQIQTSLPFEFLILLPAFSMLVSILFDSRTAFYATLTMALVLTGIRGNDYVTGVSMLFAGALASYSVRDIQNRMQMYQSIFFIFVGFTLPIIFFGFERAADYSLITNRLIIALLNSLISPLLTFGLLFLLERTDTFATDLRIKEFDNLNHPLLRKMSESAPGTYQHTLAVASLAERCAAAIDANPLLTKIGAYFHDAGKVGRPEYFAENQSENLPSKHELLPPKKSAEAIKKHVLQGVELAKKYRLPQRIIDFIPMHHGTSLIKHFYAKAIEEAGGKPVDEDDFRYPGPKPASRETAILMICDSAEALSRLKGRSKEDLMKILDRNIYDRILDGQFDECDITMRELNIIKETCVQTLIGMGHKRVEYKEVPKG